MDLYFWVCLTPHPLLLRHPSPPPILDACQPMELEQVVEKPEERNGRKVGERDRMWETD